MPKWRQLKIFSLRGDNSKLPWALLVTANVIEKDALFSIAENNLMRRITLLFISPSYFDLFSSVDTK